MQVARDCQTVMSVGMGACVPLRVTVLPHLVVKVDPLSTNLMRQITA